MKNNMFFIHNSSSELDNRLKALLFAEGIKGYGMYYYLVEYLSHRPGFSAPIKSVTALSQQMRTRKTYLEHIIYDFQLFSIGEDWFAYQNRSQKSTLANLKKHSLTLPVGFQEASPKPMGSVNEPCNSQIDSDLFSPSRTRAHSSSSSSINIKEEKKKRKEFEQGMEEYQRVVADDFTQKNRELLAKGRQVQEQMRVLPDCSVRPFKSFDELVEEMLNARTYMEMVAMHSRLGTTFTAHLDLIVKLFKKHVYLRGKIESMTSLGEVQSYFSNFLIPDSVNSKAVLKAIQESKTGRVANAPDGRPMGAYGPIGAPSPDNDDPYRFEYLVDGHRMYCGREIPNEAPPRPSMYSVWNTALKKWTY